VAKNPPKSPPLIDLKGSGEEARQRAKFDARRRADAENILLPKDRELGFWDANKIFETTLGMGGPWTERRKITAEDLRAFQHKVDAVRERYRYGITPKQVIGLSLDDDRQRAREQIHIAVPVYGTTQKTNSETTAVVRFMTNAGPDSQAKPPRHHVHVQFMSFYAAVEATGLNAKKAAQWLRTTHIRFDCDCGRHTFFYRFIASTGGFAYGRVETGFPKIRNPNLTGITCKHVIRVMQQIDSSSVVLNFLSRMIENARSHHTGKAQARTSQKQAEAIAKRQAARPAQIRALDERALERLRTSAYRNTQRKKPPAPTRQRIAKAADPQAEMRRQLAGKGFTPEQIDTIMAITQGKQ
jgi:hypothetical protein